MEANQEASAEKTPLHSKEAASREEAAMAEKIAAAKALDAKVAAAMGDAPADEKMVETKEFVSLAGLASQGREALLDALRAHAEKPKPVYTPPAMTERQLSNREEELEAGRRAVARATAQADQRPAPTEDRTKEGYTTPVFRPTDQVPDPTVDAPSGVVAGTKQFSPDA